ncbi:MAG: type II toxin-antitoxin system VapC family toxin, partial [Candidatus Micrarchaeaceae archaeon]
MSENDIYLDTSAIAKRYIKEKDSEKVDDIYRNAEMGNSRLYFSSWNLGEAIGVFDKQRAAVDPKLRLEPFLDECVKYVVSGVLTIIDVSYDLVIKSSELVLKHHIYMADALQIATAKNVGAGILV